MDLSQHLYYFGTNSLPVDASNLAAANRLLSMATPTCNYPTVTTGPLNLAPIQQMYVHSNLSDYSTLTMTGASDVLCCIPVDQSYGSVVFWSPYGPIDVEAQRLDDGTILQIHIWLTDARGVLIPVSLTSSIFIALTLLELPTM